jgi:hypothetical protein
MDTGTEIYFYRLNNKFGYLSNFYRTNFVDEHDRIFNCSEQYFMFHKCLTFDKKNKKLLTAILEEDSPKQIKKYGRQVKNYSEEIWNELRFGIMLNGLRLKFSQNAVIKQKLIDTKDKILYEASKHDNIWGIGFEDYEAIKKDKSEFGRNLLRQALMAVRMELL